MPTRGWEASTNYRSLAVRKCVRRTDYVLYVFVFPSGIVICPVEAEITLQLTVSFSYLV